MNKRIVLNSLTKKDGAVRVKVTIVNKLVFKLNFMLIIVNIFNCS